MKMDYMDYGQLIRGITVNANQYISKALKAYGMNQGQFEYFLIISYSPGINQLELARMKNVGKASVTKALKILEEDGFIKRVPDENDRRSSLCYLTEKGETITEDMLIIKAKARERMFAGFDEEEKKELLRYLNMLYRNSETLISE